MRSAHGKFSRWILFLVLALSIIGSSAVLAAGEVKIGFLGALTGNVATYGIQTLRGMEMAADEINAAGGVLGQKLVIVKEDDRGDKTEIANVTQKFISKDHVSAIIGDPTTGGTKVAAPIAQENKVILLSAGAVGAGVVEIGDFIFRNTVIDSSAAPAVTKYIVEQFKWKRIALVTSINNDYSVGLSRIFEEAVKDNGGGIVVKENVSDGDTDFSAQVTKLKAAKPDGMIFTGYYTEGALLMKELRKQGLNINMVGGDGLLSPVLSELGGKAVEGSMVYAGFSPERPSPETRKFLDAYRAKYHEEADMFVAQGYDAVKIVVAAMKRAKSTEPQGYRKELAETKGFPGVSGNTTFLPNREPLKSPICLLVVRNGKFGLLERIPVSPKK